MMEKVKKIKWKIIIVFIFSIVVYNLFWLGWRYFKYQNYTENLKVFRENYSYILNGEDGFLYNAKLPDYLTYTGNLCVATKDGKVGLLIWPKAFAGYRSGVQIEVEGIIYSIMLNEDFTAEDPYFDELVNEYMEIILLLREKADDMWGIYSIMNR